jgi:hypothetical protein
MTLLSLIEAAEADWHDAHGYELTLACPNGCMEWSTWVDRFGEYRSPSCDICDSFGEEA